MDPKSAPKSAPKSSADEVPKTKAPKGYVPEKGSEDNIHAILRMDGVDQETYEPKFHSRTCEYNPTEWKQFCKFPGGFSVLEYLHVPAKGFEKIETYKERITRIKKERAAKKAAK